MMSELVNPGTDNQAPGTYKEVGPRGGEIKNGRVVTIAKGDRLPPTQEAGHKWKKQYSYKPLTVSGFFHIHML